MYDTMKILLSIIASLTAFVFIRNLINIFTTNTNETLYRKRLKQLKFNQKRKSSDDEDTLKLIETVTSPVMKFIIPKIDLDDDKKMELEKKLEMAKWDKMFTPLTFIAMDITLKILGTFFLFLLFPKSKLFAVIWFSVLFFGFKFLFNNSIKERSFKILCEFPELIRITQGFLSSNMPLTEAFENAMPYIGDEWKPLIREFVVNSSIYSQEDCLNIISSKIDIFEVKELWSLIKLNAEQGIEIKECFENQAEKVRAMQLDVMMNKIGKREVLSILIQAPLLLCMIVGFGLPTLNSMINIAS